MKVHSTSLLWIAPALACLLLASACGPETADIDLDSWDLDREEKLFERLVSHLVVQNGSSLYNMTILQRFGRTIEETLGDREELSVLEIGPGRNLAVGVMLVLQGIRRYSAVDIYQHPELYEPTAYRNLHRLAQAAGWELSGDVELDDLVRIEDDRVHLDPDRIEWLYPYESYAFPKAEGSVDFVFSCSGFEHFNEPRRTVEKIFRVLRPGGVTAHSIDLSDHRDPSLPYDFLKLSAGDWRARFTADDLHLYTNRWRAVDFLRAFAEAGFEIIEDSRTFPYPWSSLEEWQSSRIRVEHSHVTEALKRSFHSDFQGYSLEELSATYLWIVARKPGGPGGDAALETGGPGRAEAGIDHGAGD